MDETPTRRPPSAAGKTHKRRALFQITKVRRDGVYVYPPQPPPPPPRRPATPPPLRRRDPRAGHYTRTPPPPPAILNARNQFSIDRSIGFARRRTNVHFFSHRVCVWISDSIRYLFSFFSRFSRTGASCRKKSRYDLSGVFLSITFCEGGGLSRFPRKTPLLGTLRTEHTILVERS